MKKRFVLSAVNIVDGGPLTILASFIAAMQSPVFADWQFVVLSHPSVKLRFGKAKRLNLAQPKSSWLIRLYYEYFVFKKISRKLEADIWLSLHDLTPDVFASRRFVYCHNPAPFFKPSWHDIWLDPKFFIFNKLYKFFYRINIDSNEAIIVQQHWLKDEFEKFSRAPIHVSHPVYEFPKRVPFDHKKREKLTFIFPAFPRFFKNHVVICEALRSLSEEERQEISVVFTLSGAENRYAAWLLNNYRHISGLKFLGRLTYEETQKLYQDADVVLFPSKLETWGLPLTEAKHFGKPIICADLPYAIETLGGYSNVLYVPVDSPDKWAEAIRRSLSTGGRGFTSAVAAGVRQPDSVGVMNLLGRILEKKVWG